MPLCLSPSWSISGSLCCHPCHCMSHLPCVCPASRSGSLPHSLSPSPLSTSPPRMRQSGDPQGEGRDCPKLLTIPSPALQDGPALQGDTGKGWFQLGLGGGDGGRGKGRRGEERKEGGKGGRWPWAGGQTARLLGNQPHSPSCGRAELWRLLPPPPHPPARPPLPLPHRWPWSLPGTLSFYVL